MPVNRVSYRIGWQSANDHLFDIEITFRAKAETTRLELPVWRPGRYLIQNYAANVRQWEARGRRGRSLSIEKTGKSAWLVTSEPRESVTVSYRFFAGLLDAGSSFLDETEAWVNGSNLFMMVVPLRSFPATLSIAAPRSWKIETQLERDEAGIFRARDYDHLIDSPMLASPAIRVHRFRESGCTVSMVFQGASHFDSKQFVDPVRRIVKGHARLFGSIPCSEYRFLYHAGSMWHGVEHEDSSSIILRRLEMIGAGPGSEAWDHTLAITSHEFFHLWNVKRIMPRRFLPYDYSTETPTRLLWMMEGITSYYGEAMLLRSGVWSQERYLRHLASEIRILESSPGKEFLSLSQASFDGWLQEPAQMHDKANAWISFYNKGEIVAALLDLEIRRRTKGRRSLDDVMRFIWDHYGRRAKGLEEDDLPRIVAKVSGVDLSGFFSRYVDGVDPLPYEESFGATGVAIGINPVFPSKFSLGITPRKSEGRLLVDTVRSDGSGRAAGLLPGDEIIAADRIRVANEALLDHVLEAGGGAVITLLISRDDTVREICATPGASSEIAVSLRVKNGAGPGELELLEGWLGPQQEKE